MADLERLSIVIDVIDQFEDELDRLLVKLAEVEAAVQAVDDIRIDVDVRGEHELDALAARMAAIEAADLSGVGGVDADADIDDEHDFTRLSAELAAIDSMDPTVNVDVDVHGRHKLDLLLAQLAAIEAADLTGLGDVDLGGIRIAGGGGGDTSETVSDTTRSMARAADAADDAADSFFEADLRMSDVHNALAMLVPMLLVLLGAIPAVIGALVALAAAAVAAGGALAALTGFAALGFAAEQGGQDNLGQGLQEAWNQIVEDFLDAFMPLAERLAPLFEDALDGLDRFFQAIANEGDALTQLADEARAFGQFLIDTVPPFLRDVALFAQAASEALGEVAEGIGSVDWFAEFAGLLADVLPALVVFGAQLAALIPHLVGMSIGFLEVANAILFVLNVFMEIITLGGILDKQIGVVVASVLALYGAIVILNSALFTTAGAALVSVGQAIVSLLTTIPSLTGTLSALRVAIVSTATSFNFLAAAIGATGIGILAVIFGSIASNAAGAATNIDSATQSLREFQRQSNRMGNANNPYADPDVQHGEGVGQSRFAGSNITVNVEGNADSETLRNQLHNGMYRMERPQRGV